jgi:peptidoglycan/LPS O-acetylase OafA/YrhL
LFEGRFPYTLDQILIHTLILPREWLNSRLIDGVSWTLEIELVFYIFMAVFGSAMLRSGLFAIVIASAIFGVAGIALTFLPGWDWIARQFGTMPMLFSGCAFYLLYRDRSSVAATAAIVVVGVAVPAAVMAISTRFSPIWPGWIAGYVVGAGLFSLAYYFRDRVRTSWALNHLSEISYPLYASHVFLSYTIMYSLLRIGYPAWLTFLLMFFFCYAVALAIHLAVERPCLRLIGALKGRK